MQDVYVVAATRTAFGKMGGALKSVTAEELAAVVLKDIIKRANISAEQVDEVILGQTRQSTEAANIARYALLLAGYPETVPAYTIMQQCSSGMLAVHNAMDKIMLERADCIVAGGTESLSNAIFYLRNARYGLGVGNNVLVDSVPEGQVNSQPTSIYGTFSLSRRVGFTIGNSLGVLMLGWIGYDANLTVQAASTLTGVKVLCVLLPGIFALGSWVAFRFVWNITPAVREKMRAAAEAKKASAE